MSKDKLIKHIAKAIGFTQHDTNVMLTKAMQVVRQSVIDGHEVCFENFGTFKTRHRAAIIARNLKGKANAKNGKPAPMVLPARKIPQFKPCKNFLTAAA